MKPARAVFFDFDSTLLDNSGNAKVLEDTCQALSSEYETIDGEELLKVDREIFIALFTELEQDWTLGRIRGQALGREAWHRALLKIGCTEESVLPRLLQIHEQKARAALRLFDDVQPLIDQLRRSRIPLALITNSASDIQRPKIEALEIGAWFDSNVISSEIGQAKPDPSVFRVAMSEMKVSAEDVWHVGDNLSTDVAGANLAGLKSVWLNRFDEAREPESPIPDLEVTSLTELLDIWIPAAKGDV